MGPSGSGKSKLLVDISRNYFCLFFDMSEHQKQSDVLNFHQKVKNIFYDENMNVNEKSKKYIEEFQKIVYFRMLIFAIYLIKNENLNPIDFTNIQLNNIINEFFVSFFNYFDNLKDFVQKIKVLNIFINKILKKNILIILDEVNLLVSGNLAYENLIDVEPDKKRSIYWPIFSSITKEISHQIVVILAGTSISILDSEKFMSSVGKIFGADKESALKQIVLRRILNKQDSKKILKRLFNEKYFDENKDNFKSFDEFCEHCYNKIGDSRFRIYTSLLGFIINGNENNPVNLKLIIDEYYKKLTSQDIVWSFFNGIVKIYNKYKNFGINIFVNILKSYFFENGIFNQIDDKNIIDLMSYGLCMIEDIGEKSFKICEPIIVETIFHFFRKEKKKNFGMLF